jgi:uncharacterized protein (DUF1015 family)
MATVRPFKAFRPLSQEVAAVASKPYDVLTSEEARSEAEGNPLSFLHVSKPEIDLSPGIDPYDERVYRKGKENLRKLMDGSILKQDPLPSFYLYAQTKDNRTQFGIVGCVSATEYLNDTIKKHELTRKEKEDDRTRHIMATNAHTGPVLLTYRSDPAIDAVVDRLSTREPDNNFVADDGVRHRLWIIDNAGTIRSVPDLFTKVQNLYVADGHHRSAAAVRIAQELAARNPEHRGDEEYNFFLAVLFPHDQLRIMDYNRAVKDLNRQSASEFLKEVDRRFGMKPQSSQARPAGKGEIGMYLGGQWYTLVIDPRLQKGMDPVQQLDVSVLQNHLLAPVLGIEDPRTDRRIDFVGGIRGLNELERRVDSGEMSAAFALYPPSMEELLAIADAGKFMPPKSTWFEPKLRDGLVVHMLS